MNELCIGGGGIDGLSFIGALEYIHQNKLLDLKTFYGCSVGSLIGVLYISGVSPTRILSIIINLDLSQFIKYDFSNMKTNKSLLDNKLLMELADNLDEYKDITIEQFSDKYKVDINIYATNINTYEYTNFNKKTFPEIRIKDAIMASMSVPFIFPPVKIGDDYYIDGCVKNILGLPPKEICILGYTIILKNVSKSYMGTVIKSMIKNDYPPNSLYIIECNCDNGSQDILNAANKITPNYILDLYKGGIKCAREQLE
jgi:NTE family protein